MDNKLDKENPLPKEIKLNARQRRDLKRKSMQLNHDKKENVKSFSTNVNTKNNEKDAHLHSKVTKKLRRIHIQENKLTTNSVTNEIEKKKKELTNNQNVSDCSLATTSDNNNISKKSTDMRTIKEKKQKKLIPNKIRFTLFVGQLPFNTTIDDIKNHFSEAGDIKVRLLTDKKTKKFRGIAFIEVNEQKAIGAALSRHHTLLKGRRINVEITVSGGGNKSEIRKTKLTNLREKQKLVQTEKVKALLEKYVKDTRSNILESDIDDRLIDFLAWFDYATAKSAIEEFSACVTDNVINRKGFFMGILKRYRPTDGIEN